MPPLFPPSLDPLNLLNSHPPLIPFPTSLPLLPFPSLYFLPHSPEEGGWDER